MSFAATLSTVSRLNRTGATTLFVLLVLCLPAFASAVTLPFPARIGGGGTNSNATGNGELYVQNDLEADGHVFMSGLTDGGATDYTVCIDGTTGELIRLRTLACGIGGDGDIAEWHETATDVRRGDIVVPSNAVTSRTVEITDPLTREKTGETYVVNTPVMEKADYASRNRALGAIATQPAQIIGVDILSVATHPQPVGISGHIPVRMTLDNGDITIGDPIAVSRTTPGAGMKATESGRIIGWALEPFSANATSEDGMIEVTIHLQDWVAPSNRAFSIADGLRSLGGWIVGSLLSLRDMIT